MDWLFGAFILLVLLFGSAVFFGAPYLPTKRRQVKAALDLLNLKPGQTLLELGCGDGRILKAAAARGIKCIGYELNPVLVVAAKLSTYKHRQLVTVRWGNYWTADWPAADGIYIFLLSSLMHKLDGRIIKWRQKHQLGTVKLASFAFKVPDKKIAKEQAGIFLYEYK